MSALMIFAIAASVCVYVLPLVLVLLIDPRPQDSEEGGIDCAPFESIDEIGEGEVDYMLSDCDPYA